MGEVKDIITNHHLKFKRDYSARALPEKPKVCEVAKQFGFDYWDGSRDSGYGGYHNDGRWLEVAKKLISRYNIQDGESILDVGCGKGFLVEAFQDLLPNSDCRGFDISSYAIENSSPKVQAQLEVADVSRYAFSNKSFDHIFSFNTLHNLYLPDLFKSLAGIQSACRKSSYICVESYRNESEKWNLMQWQLTCECFYTPEEWLWIFQQAGYEGDHEFIFFE